MTNKEKLGFSLLSSIFITICLPLSLALRYSGEAADISRNELIGIFLFLFVGHLIYFFLIREEKIGICPGCENMGRLNSSKATMCDKCGTRLEKLEGFYKRNPEYKKRYKKNN